MVSKKIQPLRIIKKKAGNEIHKPSLSLILTIKPSNICKKRPKEENYQYFRIFKSINGKVKKNFNLFLYGNFLDIFFI